MTDNEMLGALLKLLDGDPLAVDMVEDAAGAFSGSRDDRALLRRLRRDSQRLAEDFLDAYSSQPLTAEAAEEARNALSQIRVPRRIGNVRADLALIYRHLGIIRSYGPDSVELDYPQCLADPLILRAYSLGSIAGGYGNTASGGGSAVSGGWYNTAYGFLATVGGGGGGIQVPNYGWAAGAGNPTTYTGNFRSQ